MKPFVSLLLCLFFLNANAQQTKDPAALVQEWNTANNKQDIGTLIYFYDNEVLFYGTKLKKQECIAGKLSVFKKYPTLDQQIAGQVKTETLENGDVKCSFDKAVNTNGAIKTYASYLVFHKIDNAWKIVVESDLTTDANVEKRKWKAKGAVACDVDGDGVKEYAYLVPPPIDTTKEMECQDDSCVAHIRFSNRAIPDINIVSCIGGGVDVLGDLNNDGKDEIGINPQWWTSCWSGYHVYTLKNGKWIDAVPVISTHCNQWEQGVKVIEKDPKKPGYVIIHYSQLTEDDIVTRTKSVPIK
ncbi:hypothetical protein [Chitinophaga sp.]|uniref:hypothetical protein n=1 Tax=Chitinophaga sp. TaxID=1869181 RepID=UPI0031D723A6